METQELKHSENLILEGEEPDFIKQIKISKDIPKPHGWSGSKGSRWDHLLIKLEQGDSIEFNQTDSVSFTSRARGLGYCIACRKTGDDSVRVWFEGLNPNRKIKQQ